MHQSVHLLSHDPDWSWAPFKPERAPAILAGPEAIGKAEGRGCGDNKSDINSAKRQRSRKLTASPKEKIGDLLTSSISKDLLLDFEHNAYEAFDSAKYVGAMHAEGLRSTGVGYNLHLFLNDALARALRSAGVSHPPMRGNSIVHGAIGSVTLMRIHKSHVQWGNAGRSKGKKQLCARNKEVTEWFQPDFLREVEPASVMPEVTVSLVTQGAASSDGIAIYIVVTNEEMDLRNPLFCESLPEFMQRYQRVPSVEDKAFSKLRKQQKKANNSNGPEEQDTSGIT